MSARGLIHSVYVAICNIPRLLVCSKGAVRLAVFRFGGWKKDVKIIDRQVEE